MTFSLGVAATAFVLIFPVELPDKTFVATLVLATRYRPLFVWIGVSAAFLVQTLVACLAGALLDRLPRTPVEVGSALLFLLGGVILWCGAARADQQEAQAEEEFEQKVGRGAAVSGVRAVSSSFLVLFLAEWGDLSQLLTANLVIRYDDAVSIGVGAFLALVALSGMAAALGRALLARVRLSLIRRIGGTVCFVLGGVTTLGVVGVKLGPLG